MALLETEENDFKNLFLMIYEVRLFCEGLSSSTYDVNTLFRSAKVLENSYTKFEIIGALEEFQVKLNEFWKIKGLGSIPLQFLKKVSEEVLSKYITDGKFSNDDVKYAIRQFLLNRPEKDFIELIQRLHSTHHSVEVLKNLACKSTSHRQNDAVLYSEEFVRCLILSGGNVEELDSLVTKIVSDNENNLLVLLKLLCVESNVPLSAHVQEVVVHSINKLLREPININLYSHLLELNNDEFSCIFSRWTTLYETVVDIVEFSLQRLQCKYTDDSYCWIYTENEKVLVFANIVSLINKLKLVTEKDLCDKLRDLLNRLKSAGSEIIVEDVMRICKIKQ